MTLPNEFRERAQEQSQAALKLSTQFEIQQVEQEDGTTVQFIDLTMLVPAVVGHVKASLYSALAEVVEHEQLADHPRHPIQERNHAIRHAAAIGVATGDWSEFDAIASRGGVVGGDATGGGGPAAGEDGGDQVLEPQPEDRGQPVPQ